MMVDTKCALCGLPIRRHSSKIRPMNFCSRACLGEAVSKGLLVKDTSKTSAHMSEYNREHNPTAMDSSRRAKLRQAHLGTGEGKTYAKLYGRHEHVVVAERILGRKLRPDEVVHHIDRNKRNNDPSNLVVLTREEHGRLHQECAEKREVMSDAFQALSVSAGCRTMDS